jgi:hypothetical protein
VRRQREERSSLIELCSGRAGGDGVGVSIARLQDLLLQAIANESGFVFLAGVAIQLSHNVRRRRRKWTTRDQTCTKASPVASSNILRFVGGTSFPSKLKGGRLRT